MTLKSELVEAVKEHADNIRAFAQDLLDMCLERGAVGNAMAIRDEANALLALVSARAALTAAEGAGDGWLPIESAPKDGTPVDLWTYWPEHDVHRREANARWNEVAEEWQLGTFHTGQFMHRPKVTHWRPLPPAPSDKGPRS